jgi:3-methyladenine DNA glycosylase AlkD
MPRRAHGKTVAATVRSVTAALRRMARPAGSFDATRYFRGDHGLAFYNVGTARVRRLARDLYTANKAHWTVDDAMRVADVLMRDPHLEAKSVGLELVARFRTSFTPALLPRWKRWLAANLSANWATTDTICGLLIGPLLADRPALAPRLRAWAGDRNMWVRRASAVGLIPSIRRGAALDLAYEIAARLHADREDLIQKAVGWMLREAGKADMTRLERYLIRNGARIPRTTLRYAIERFAEPRRRAILATTSHAALARDRSVRRGAPAARPPRR